MKYTPTNMTCTELLELDGDTLAEYWTGDLIDERGTVYRDGAHKVKVTPAGRKLSIPAKTKTFRGEAAWMDAERLWRDLQFWLGRTRPW